MELGIDIMVNGLQFMLAEFPEVRYATPYPHLLKAFSDTYEEISAGAVPKIRHQIRDFFAERRLDMMKSCIDRFASQGEDVPAKLRSRCLGIS